ncbi:XRE family transcriptional regulator [Mesorhizobium sp. CAU 1741]|uniref:helix-turn-helix domain-containing protein n=1 Tax=Mesorhizobium sp. CAU 1741 TaxID=3140366 RepID=UPI00325A48EB
MMITGAQCRAGRALAELSREVLAKLCGVEETIIERFERQLAVPDDTVIAGIASGLEEAGIVFIPENGGGVGVRLKFNASETKRLSTLEGEGGRAALDDVP